MLRFRVPFCMHRTGLVVVLLCVLVGVRMGGWQLGLPLGALLLASLLLHEMGHIVAATSLKVPVREIGLKLGGAYIRRAHAHRHRDEVLIAASGPLMNLLIAVPFLFIPRLGLQLAICNVVLGVANLLPLPSSDGLRIVRNLWAMIVTGDRKPALNRVQSISTGMSRNSGPTSTVDLKKAA